MGNSKYSLGNKFRRSNRTNDLKFKVSNELKEIIDKEVDLYNDGRVLDKLTRNELLTSIVEDYFKKKNAH